MEVFVARQPIFNQNEGVIAYELLYRNGKVNAYNNQDGDQATSDVIVNSFLNIGITELTEGKQCFINFTENLLKKKLPSYFSPSLIVVEVLENIEITAEIVELCKELKSTGYTIALDDFFLQHGNEHLLTLLHDVDIIKIDFLATTKQTRTDMMSFLKPYNVKFLGEKIETREEYEEAKQAGYEYFQGYFFSKPVILESRDIPPYYHSYLLLLQQLDMPDPDVEKITNIIEKDLSISYKLLKLINSPINRPRFDISSIKQAVILLGLIEIKKWIYVLMLRGVQNSGSRDKMKELIELSLTRAKLAELIAKEENQHGKSSKYFLLGMFSLIETFLQIPMEQIVTKLPLSQEIKEALTGKENHLSNVLQLIKAIERMEFNDEIVKSFPSSFSKTNLFSLYSEAKTWALQLTKQLDEI